MPPKRAASKGRAAVKESVVKAAPTRSTRASRTVAAASVPEPVAPEVEEDVVDVPVKRGRGAPAKAAAVVESTKTTAEPEEPRAKPGRKPAAVSVPVVKSSTARSTRATRSKAPAVPVEVQEQPETKGRRGRKAAVVEKPAVESPVVEETQKADEPETLATAVATLEHTNEEKPESSKSEEKQIEPEKETTENQVEEDKKEPAVETKTAVRRRGRPARATSAEKPIEASPAKAVVAESKKKVEEPVVAKAKPARKATVAVAPATPSRSTRATRSRAPAEPVVEVEPTVQEPAETKARRGRKPAAKVDSLPVSEPVVTDEAIPDIKPEAKGRKGRKPAEKAIPDNLEVEKTKQVPEPEISAVSTEPEIVKSSEAEIKSEAAKSSATSKTGEDTKVVPELETKPAEPEVTKPVSHRGRKAAKLESEVVDGPAEKVDTPDVEEVKTSGVVGEDKAGDLVKDVPIDISSDDEAEEIKLQVIEREPEETVADRAPEIVDVEAKEKDNDVQMEEANGEKEDQEVMEIADKDEDETIVSNQSSICEPVATNNGKEEVSRKRKAPVQIDDDSEDITEILQVRAKKPRIEDVIPIVALRPVTGQVMTCGSDNAGELGLREPGKEKRRPTIVDDITEPVSLVVTGAMHTIAVTADGSKVYTFGCNDEGALGRHTLVGNRVIALPDINESLNSTVEGEPVTTEKLEATPGLVDIPAIKVVKVTAGDSHTAALTNVGALYVWGCFRVSLQSDVLRKSRFTNSLCTYSILGSKRTYRINSKHFA